jgi:aminoglycoside phosphotransferase (APT) family kinase protein
MLRWPSSVVEPAVFGTRDPERIAVLASDFCSRELGNRPVEGIFYRASAGAVIGLILRGGLKVVLKVYQPRWSAPFLAATQRVQRHLADQQFPCPGPVVPPKSITEDSPCLATVDTWLPDPGMTALADRNSRRISATGLARQIDLAADLDSLEGLDAHPLQHSAGDLYPEPHSPLFDLSGTAEGAEWIDELARRGAEQREADDSDAVIAHLDWSARNVRLGDREVVAAYDWDSVGLAAESTAIGQAAATWSVTSEPGGSTFPSATDVAGFLCDYETASGRTLTAMQWRAAAGAVVWLLAYIARCEHSLEVTGRARSDQTGARDSLMHDGDELLNLGPRHHDG